MSGAAALAYGLPWRARADDLPKLHELAATKGLIFGSDSDTPIDKAPAAYSELFEQQCSLYACTLSWKHMAPQQDSPPNVWEDPNIGFARAHGLRLTGGHLLWHGTEPDWLKTVTDRTAFEKVVRDHIAAVTARYGADTYSWNVVNEALNAKDGRPDGLRNSLYLQQLGPNYFDLAFRAAQAGSPNVLRVYNDYSLEMDTPEQDAKRAALLGQLDRWIAMGTPIDAVGLQSHLRINKAVFNENKFRDFLKEIASRKLKILVTELDVFEEKPADIPTRDVAVADFYTRYLDVVLDEPAVKAVVTWGLSDRYSWANNPAFKKIFYRADKLPARPLPFDHDFQPKPAFYAIQAAFQRAGVRTA